MKTGSSLIPYLPSLRTFKQRCLGQEIVEPAKSSHRSLPSGSPQMALSASLHPPEKLYTLPEKTTHSQNRSTYQCKSLSLPEGTGSIVWWLVNVAVSGLIHSLFNSADSWPEQAYSTTLSWSSLWLKLIQLSSDLLWSHLRMLIEITSGFRLTSLHFLSPYHV